MTIERKKLTMKSSSSMFQAPSKAEMIEIDLRSTIQDILNSSQQLPMDSFNERYRKGLATREQLVGAIKNSHDQFQTAIAFPAKRKELFESMIKNIGDYLSQQGLDTKTFQDVVESLQQPKAQLPKVALTSMRMS